MKLLVSFPLIMAPALEQPKKAVSAYWLWLADNREAITKKVGKGGPEVLRQAGEQWKVLPAAKKAPYEAKAAASKAEFDKSLAAFTAAGGVMAKRQKKDKDGKRKKAKKNPDAPKKPVGGTYGIFLAEKREEIKKALPADHKITDVTKKAGEMWAAAKEADKKKYETIYQKKNEEYKVAMEAWKKANPADGAGEDEDAADEDEEDDEEEDAEEEKEEVAPKGKAAVLKKPAAQNPAKRAKIGA